MTGLLRWGSIIVAVALLWLVLVVPNAVDRLEAAAFLRLPLELPALLLMLVLVPPRVARFVRPVVAVLLFASLVLRVADAGLFTAFGRPFDPVLDLPLAGSGWALLSGAIGQAAAALAVAGLLAAVTATFAILSLALAHTDAPLRSRRGVAGLGASLLILIGLKTFAVAGPGGGELVTYEASHSLADHAAASLASLEDRTVFAAAIADDPLAGLPQDGRLTTLAGKDVLLVFVESYGRSAIEGECCVDRTTAALDRFDERLEQAGYSARTGYLTSTVVGGQSWLAHATALSGLPIDSQQRYRQFLASERTTLVDDFGRAGWKTAAVMPAITLDWPEGRRLGYDAIHDRDRLGYRGKPFNWVTMPDQYTLSALNRLELSQPSPRRPVMAEVALISSHAPWTPIPQVIDWSEVGDGRAFDRFAEMGPTPEEVWTDPERVREQFSLSIDYALDALSSFVLQQQDRNLVLIVLGDHQPAPLVTGPNAGRDVPAHILSRDPAVLAAIENWGWTQGMRPRPGTPTFPMTDLRERLVRSMTPRD